MNKVLLVAPLGDNVGGISRWTGYIDNYYKSIAQPEVILKTCSTLNENSVFVSNHNRTFGRAKIALKSYPALKKKIITNIKEFQPNVVHITSSASLGLFRDIMILRMLRKKRVKTIVHFRFGRIPELARNKNWEWRVLKKVIKLADRIITIDDNSYKTLIREGFNNIVNIPNPLSPSVEKIIDSKKNIIKRVDRKVVFAGHLILTKGVYELVEACSQIDNINLTLVGRPVGDIANQLKKIAQRKNEGEWLSIIGEKSTEDVIEEMLSAAVFVLPTYTEGFPNVILESMACSCPIVASGVGAIPEMLENNAGIVIKPKDIDELKKAIESVLDNPSLAKQIGSNACEKVRQNYSMSQVWARQIKLWNNI